MTTVANVVLVLLTLSAGGSAYRVLKGPSLPDRFVAVDVIGVHVMAMVAVFSVRQGSLDFIDVILSIAVLSFISTVAIAKFLVTGKLIDNGSQPAADQGKHRRSRHPHEAGAAESVSSGTTSTVGDGEPTT